MSFVLSSKSMERLQGVHPDLQRLVRATASSGNLAFSVIEGLRTAARQRLLFNSGATRTLNSRHLTGHAVDIAPMISGAVSWAWPSYYPLAAHVKATAALIKVPVTWGGDWESFKDGPHWELPWAEYPLKGSP